MPSRQAASGTALPLNSPEDNNSHQARKLPPLHRQSFSPRSLLEDPIPLIHQILFPFLHFSSHQRPHAVNHFKKKKRHARRQKKVNKLKGNGSKGGLGTAGSTQTCLRVVVMFPFYGVIVYSCNQISTEEEKVTVMPPKYGDLTLGA